MNFIHKFILILAYTIVVCCHSLEPITTESSTTPYSGSYECPGEPSNTSCASYDCTTPGNKTSLIELMKSFATNIFSRGRRSGISCPNNSYCCVYEENGRTCCKSLGISVFLDFPSAPNPTGFCPHSLDGNGCGEDRWDCTNSNSGVNCTAYEFCCYQGAAMTPCCVPIYKMTTESTTLRS